MFATKFIVLASFTLSVFAFPHVKRDFTQVEVDLKAITEQVASLGGAIKAFSNPGGTLPQALAIHNGATKLCTVLQTWTAHTTELGSFTEEQGRSILDTTHSFQPAILDSLTAIMDKKPAFAALPVGGLVNLIKLDLHNLQSNTTAFDNALIAASPDDLKQETIDTKKIVDDAFAKAIATYDN